jgi:hypothetical protein
LQGGLLRPHRFRASGCACSLRMGSHAL